MGSISLLIIIYPGEELKSIAAIIYAFHKRIYLNGQKLLKSLSLLNPCYKANSFVHAYFYLILIILKISYRNIKLHVGMVNKLAEVL